MVQLAQMFPESKSQMTISTSDGSLSTMAPTRANSHNSVFDLVPHCQDASEELVPHSQDASEEGEELPLTNVKSKLVLPSRRVLVTLAALAALWAWSKYVRRIVNRPSNWGYDRPAMMASAAVTSLFGMMGVTGKSDFSQLQHKSSQNQMICIHPHGCFCLGYWLNIGMKLRDKFSPIYGSFFGGADVVFNTPLLREVGLLNNVRPASPKMIDKVISAGKSMAIAPGGIHEMLASDPTCERLFFPSNLGFVRQAMKHGVPLVPMYSFGENQLYDVPDWSRAVSRFIKKHTGAGVPLPIGRWGVPCIPKKTHVQTYAGCEVEVGPANPEPTDAQVRAVFLRYCTELHRLFDKYSASALPAEVAAKGLTLIWRGHESEDLSGNSVDLALRASASIALAPDDIPSEPQINEPAFTRSRL